MRRARTHSSVENSVGKHEIASFSTETDKLCFALLEIVKADELLDGHANAETIVRWTEALKGFSAKKKDETFDEWISEYDSATLKEICDFIIGMEKIAEVEFDLSNIRSIRGLTQSESVVMCGFRALQRKYLQLDENVNMNPHKYSVLKAQFLRSCRYWIFVVTDQPKDGLTAEQIFETRMKDEFWGLGERTPNRRRLKQGDKVIFSYGANFFLGTSTLASDSYEPQEEERDRLGHGKEFFASKYGVKLAKIEVWDAPKPVNEFVEDLDFIKRKDSPVVHFQGGVRAISEHDYELIVGKEKILALVGATDADYVAGRQEIIALKGKVWSGWTFRTKEKECEQLNDQLAKYGTFRVYLHHIKSRGGSGDIEFIGLVDRYVTSRRGIDTPEPDFTDEGEIRWYREASNEPSRTWLRFIEIDDLDDFIEVGKLKDYNKNTPINPSTLQNRFAPVVDIFGPPAVTPGEIELSTIDRAAITHLVAGRNLIFYGPPGTGKTRKAVQIAKFFCGDADNSFSFETANAEWTAYNVVGGPTLSGEGELSFKPGFLTWAAIQCSYNIKSSGLPHFLIIDEINRANLDLAFGKIFSLLDIEYRNQAILGESDLSGMKNADEYRDARLPLEFRILATMNTYDTALLFSLGYAFRRRFAFIEISSPFTEQLEEKYEPDEDQWRKLEIQTEDRIKDLAEEIKKWISSVTYLQPSTSLKLKLQVPQDFDFAETLQSLNKRIEAGEFDPFNAYKLACSLSESLTREGVIEAGYAQAVDVVKYALVYTAIFSKNSEKVDLVAAIDEAVMAYFIPQIQYYLPRARRTITIGKKEEAEAAIGKLQALQNKFQKLGLIKSGNKLEAIISRLRAGKSAFSDSGS